jgi:hypothetical protein
MHNAGQSQRFGACLAICLVLGWWTVLRQILSKHSGRDQGRFTIENQVDRDNLEVVMIWLGNFNAGPIARLV